MNHVMTDENIKRIYYLRNRNISIAKISEFLDININTIITHLRIKSYEKELKEALPNLTHRSHFRSPKGYTPGKNKPIINTLEKNINKFDSLVIIGFQHCKDIVNIMEQKYKKVIANDVRESVFIGYKGIEKIVKDAVDPKFMNTLNELKISNPNCAAYINLTGEEKLIEYIYNIKFNPIVAVVSKRKSVGHKMSSWERSKNLGFKTEQISHHTWLAIHE